MWRSVVLGSVTFILACGGRHEAAPSEPPHSAGSQQSPADAATLADGTPAAAIAAPVAAAAHTASAAAPTGAAPQRSPDEAQCSGIATRCMIRISAKGVYVNGDPKSKEEAVAACKRTVCALVAVEDDAPADVWNKLQAALRHAGIAVLMRGPVNDMECLNNPLAKGCN